MASAAVGNKKGGHVVECCYVTGVTLTPNFAGALPVVSHTRVALCCSVETFPDSLVRGWQLSCRGLVEEQGGGMVEVEMVAPSVRCELLFYACTC